jgi:murein DD-endopeptidase MepM/ murein hydrolase activator NlpD
MATAKYVTLMIIPEGGQERRGIRIRTWFLQVILGFIGVVLIGILLFFLFYGKVIGRAAMADSLKSENERLLKYQYKVQLLERNLNQTRDIATLDEEGMAAVTRSAGPDLSLPIGLPAKGFITQDFSLNDSSHYHPGIDIACAEGTPVLATATGEIIMTGFDEVYGNIVVIKHNDSITTLYGHNKEILVEQGEQVLPGSRIALSGNTGKSTAPHVHYEIRVNDEPINPMEMQ